MTIDPSLLARLVCPDTHQSLSVAPDELISKANDAHARGTLRNPVSHALDGGLLREDGAVLYAICDGIPIMLADEGILVEQLEPTT